MNCKYLLNIRNTFDEYIKNYGYKLLNEENIFKLPVEGIEYILNSKEVIINVNELFKLLLIYSKKYGKEKEINGIISKLKVNMIDLKGLNENEIEVLFKNKNNNVKEYSSIKNVPRLKGINNTLKYIIYNNYYSDNITIDYNKITLLQKKDIDDGINQLLAEDDIKIVIICLSVIIDLKLNVEIKEGKILNKLLYYYNKTNKNIPENLLLKCISQFIDEKRIKIMCDLCGDDILHKILYYPHYLSNSQKKLLQHIFIH